MSNDINLGSTFARVVKDTGKGLVNGKGLRSDPQNGDNGPTTSVGNKESVKGYTRTLIGTTKEADNYYRRDASGVFELDPYLLPYNRSGVPDFKEEIFQTWSMEKLLHGVGLTYNRRLSRILNLKSFNKNFLRNPIDYTNYGRTYVFFTKPDLFLFVGHGGNKEDINPSIKANCPDLYAKIERNLTVARQLQSIYSVMPVTLGSKGFLHLLGNQCTDVSFPEIALTTRESAKNMKGYSTKYGGDFLEDLKSTDVTINFYDTRTRDVATMIEIWTEYIEGVSQGKIFPKRMYRDMNMIDYAVTIYLFVVDEVNNILSFSSLIGCYPKNLSAQLLQHKKESLTVDTLMGPFPYSWQVTHVSRHNAQSTIDAFNYASGWYQIYNDGQFKKQEDNHFKGLMPDGRFKEVVDFSFVKSFEFQFEGREINTSYGTGGQKLDGVLAASNRYTMHHGIEAWGLDVMSNQKIFNMNSNNRVITQLRITEFWPEFVAVVPLYTKDEQYVRYSLMFYSRTSYLKSDPVGTPYKSGKTTKYNTKGEYVYGHLFKRTRYNTWVEKEEVKGKDNEIHVRYNTVKSPIDVVTPSMNYLARKKMSALVPNTSKVHPHHVNWKGTNLNGVEPNDINWHKEIQQLIDRFGMIAVNTTKMNVDGADSSNSGTGGGDSGSKGDKGTTPKDNPPKENKPKPDLRTHLNNNGIDPDKFDDRTTKAINEAISNANTDNDDDLASILVNHGLIKSEKEFKNTPEFWRSIGYVYNPEYGQYIKFTTKEEYDKLSKLVDEYYNRKRYTDTPGTSGSGFKVKKDHNFWHYNGSKGSSVLSVEDGKVITNNAKRGIVQIQRGDHRIDTYIGVHTDLKVGSKVKQGQQIGSMTGNTLKYGNANSNFKYDDPHAPNKKLNVVPGKNGNLSPLGGAAQTNNSGSGKSSLSGIF